MYAYINNWTRGHKISIFLCYCFWTIVHQAWFFFAGSLICIYQHFFRLFHRYFCHKITQPLSNTGQDIFKQGDFLGSFFYVLYSTLLHLPPLRFHCVGGCWDRTQDCCHFGIGSQTGQDMSSPLVYLQILEKNPQHVLHNKTFHQCCTVYNLYNLYIITPIFTIKTKEVNISCLLFRAGITAREGRTAVPLLAVRRVPPPPLHHLQLRTGLPLPLPAGGTHGPHTPWQHQHSKYAATKTPFVYSFSESCAGSVPISTFMCLWPIYIFPGSVHIFGCSKIDRPILEIYESLTDIWV
jgi:hypothetical protein